MLDEQNLFTCLLQTYSSFFRIIAQPFKTTNDSKLATLAMMWHGNAP